MQAWLTRMRPTGEGDINLGNEVSATLFDAGRNRKAQPLISVVIPVRNEGAHLGVLIDDLLGQDYPRDRYEVLVVDGQSTDSTAAVVRGYGSLDSPRIRYLSNPGRLSSAGRNVGIRHSRGELVLFVDGHCRIPSGSLLSDSARIMQESGAECLCRPQPLSSPVNTWFQEIVAHGRATRIGHGRDSSIYAFDREGFVDPTSSGAAYRRSVFERVGLYDEQFDACEDVEFNHRVYCAGIPSYQSSRLAIIYQPRSSLSALFHQTMRYGKGRYRLMRKHPETASLSQLIPALFTAGLVLGGAGSLFSYLVRESFFIMILAYATLLLVASAKLGLRHGWQDFVVAPVVYLTIHLGFGLGYWAEAAQVHKGWARFSEGPVQAQSMSDESRTGPLQPETGQSSNRADLRAAAIGKTFRT